MVGPKVSKQESEVADKMIPMHIFIETLLLENKMYLVSYLRFLFAYFLVLPSPLASSIYLIAFYTC